MADRVRLAMVGCGQIAEAHLKGIGGVDSAELTFAMDVDEERARSAAERYGAERWSTSYEEVLGCSEETVKTHLDRARRTLAERLDVGSEI